MSLITKNLIMKYYLDTEFHEYKKCFSTTDTIELISIGIVREDGKEFYALCNDFNIRKAWKNTWLKENVLRKIYDEHTPKKDQQLMPFTKNNLKRLFNSVGFSKTDIKNKLLTFIPPDESSVEFYAYYGDYDWVVFCWLFGRMIDLPKYFPRHCKDLKQSLDELAEEANLKSFSVLFKKRFKDAENNLRTIKRSLHYPKTSDEHSAIADARWNKDLHEFLTRMKKLTK